MTSFTRSSLLLLSAAFLFTAPVPALAQEGAQNNEGVATSRPSLLITAGPIPESLKQSTYAKPVQIRSITPDQISGPAYLSSPGVSRVAGEIGNLSRELGAVQSRAESLANALNLLQEGNNARAADYYASVATINTRLQAGSTPGNPRLVERLGVAEESLKSLNANAAELNELGVQIAKVASEAGFLLESTRAAYRISGALEEDHIRLAELEDSTTATVVIIERILNSVNDDITRISAVLASERGNLRTLALAVTNGDLYGKSLRNRPFSRVETIEFASSGGVASDAIYVDDGADGFIAEPPVLQSPAVGLAGPRPLAKIKFDRPDVEYEQPVYQAVTQALERYPNARFDLVAVNPVSGNAAEIAIETTRARRNAEKVLRTLTQLGVPLDRIDLASDQSASASSSEVHLFVK